MTKILIVCAMQEEIDGIIYNDTDFIHEDGIYKLRKEFYEVNIVLGGIGKTSMAFKLGLILSKDKYDLIINVGVAGSISNELTPFDTLIASKVSYYDCDVTAFGYKKGQMASMPLYYEADDEILNLTKKQSLSNIKYGLIISGDKFITKENLSVDVYSDFDNPLAVDMESGAVAQVSYMAKIPFLIIRSISDSTSGDGSNKDEYENNLTRASKRAGEIVWMIIDEISK